MWVGRSVSGYAHLDDFNDRLNILHSLVLEAWTEL